MTALDALAHAERALLEHAATGRRRVRAGALTACLGPCATDALMHVAVPCGSEPRHWDASVEALIALRHEHGFVPRLEFMAELHQGLAPALERHGFVRASADPVMVADLHADLVPAAVGARPYRRLSATDAGLLSAFVEAQAGAFGMPAATGYAFLDRLHDTLASGAAMAATVLDEGAPAAGAVVQLSPSGWAELAGVFTAAARRRRGLAVAVCSRLLLDARAAGVTHAWLSAADGADRLYARLGFSHAGTQLAYRYAPASTAPA